jgi:transcriptional regulator with XRE-family HTH domain
MQGQLMNIGEKIKQLRTDKNLTQPQLAEAIGIEQSYLSKLENDKSIPSADIFQAVLRGLSVDVGTFLQGVDDAIIRGPLKQIPDVALYLNNQLGERVHNIKKWLFGSAAACVIGLTLIVAGYKTLIFPASVFEYRSNGLVKKGEPDDVFENSNSYLMKVDCPFFNNSNGDTEECKALRKDMQLRARQETMLLETYQGNTIYRELDGGRQVFFSRGTHSSNNPVNRYLILLGSFLTFSGIFGFVVELRLRKI